MMMKKVMMMTMMTPPPLQQTSAEVNCETNLSRVCRSEM
jgi:hypothetical protein